LKLLDDKKTGGRIGRQAVQIGPLNPEKDGVFGRGGGGKNEKDGDRGDGRGPSPRATIFPGHESSPGFDSGFSRSLFRSAAVRNPADPKIPCRKGSRAPGGCQPLIRPASLSKPSRIVSGWGGQPGMNKSTGIVFSTPF
jgi:hypothetical protein